MKDFKEIAEKCLTGELSGRFVCRNGLQISSFTLSRADNPWYPYKLYRIGVLNKEGCTPNIYSQNDIIQFIPYEEMKKQQITIDIPEGMVAIQEETPGGIKIKFIKKPLDYYSVVLAQKDKHQFIHVTEMNETSKSFNKKVEVFSKLTNIRNYFGKPTKEVGFVIFYNSILKKFDVQEQICPDKQYVVFNTWADAQAAIGLLGDELKYLFEPW